MESLDFLVRSSGFLHSQFGSRCDLRRGTQDNDSFGDAIVVARIGKVKVELVRQRGELSATVKLARGESRLIGVGRSVESVRDTDENLRTLIDQIAQLLR